LEVEAMQAALPRTLCLRGNPVQANAEIVVAIGDGSCIVVPLTRSQLQQLAAEASDFAWRWRE
jgi:BarA-like signal transduction histidine kinase